MTDRFFYLDSAAATHPGRKRRTNQDYVAFFEPITEQDLIASGALYIVADGVGGAARGEKASQFAAQKVLYEYYQRPQVPPPERLVEVMQEAGNDIFRHSQMSGSRMATTMVAAAFVGTRLYVANVGDSRAYLLRNGRIRQITQDHSVVGEMIREGVLTEEEARQARVKNRLTRSLGGEPNPEVDVFEIPLRPGDRVLLCTDGLTRYAGKPELLHLASSGSPDEVVHRLIDFANQQGGADNISAIVIDVGPAVTPQEWIRRKRRESSPRLNEEYLKTVAVPPPRVTSLTPSRDRFRDIRLWVVVAVLALISGGLCTLSITMAWERVLARPTPVAPPYPSPWPSRLPSPQPTHLVFEEPTLRYPGNVGTPSATSTAYPVTNPSLPKPVSFHRKAGCFVPLETGSGVYETYQKYDQAYRDFAEQRPCHPHSGACFYAYFQSRQYKSIVYLNRPQLPRRAVYKEVPLPDSGNSLDEILKEYYQIHWVLLPTQTRTQCEDIGGKWVKLATDLPSWVVEARKREWDSIHETLTTPQATPSPMPSPSSSER